MATYLRARRGRTRNSLVATRDGALPAKEGKDGAFRRLTGAHRYARAVADWRRSEGVHADPTARHSTYRLGATTARQPVAPAARPHGAGATAGADGAAHLSGA